MFFFYYLRFCNCKNNRTIKMLLSKQNKLNNRLLGKNACWSHMFSVNEKTCQEFYTKADGNAETSIAYFTHPLASFFFVANIQQIRTQFNINRFVWKAEIQINFGSGKIIKSSSFYILLLYREQWLLYSWIMHGM